MAAGSGSRYGKLKQFDELGPKAEFLLEFSIYDAIKSGFDHIVLVTKKENQSFLLTYLTRRIPNNIKIDVVVQDINDLPKNTVINNERIKPWGTAHAVLVAKDVINEPFAVINADDYYGQNAFQGAAEFMKNNQSSSNFAQGGERNKANNYCYGTCRKTNFYRNGICAFRCTTCTPKTTSY